MVLSGDTYKLINHHADSLRSFVKTLAVVADMGTIIYNINYKIKILFSLSHLILLTVTARNFEAHGTSTHTELRNARNFENVFEALMYLIIPEPIL